jgi:hypothetical protein
MLGVSKVHWQIAGVAVVTYALLVFVQRGLGYKIPVVGQYLPGGQ